MSKPDKRGLAPLFLLALTVVATLLVPLSSWAEDAETPQSEERGKPITDRSFYTFREAIFAVNDTLCRQFTGTPGDFQLPDWRRAPNVFDHNPVGWWVALDVANDGKQRVVYAQHSGHGSRIGASQTPLIFDMSESEFLARKFERVGLSDHAIDTLGFWPSRWALNYIYTLRHADAPVFRARGIAPEMLTSDNGYVSPVLVSGKTYFVVRSAPRGNKMPFGIRGRDAPPPGTDYVSGLLLEWVAP